MPGPTQMVQWIMGGTAKWRHRYSWLLLQVTDHVSNHATVHSLSHGVNLFLFCAILKSCFAASCTRKLRNSCHASEESCRSLHQREHVIVQPWIAWVWERVCCRGCAWSQEHPQEAAGGAWCTTGKRYVVSSRDTFRRFVLRSCFVVLLSILQNWSNHNTRMMIRGLVKLWSYALA